ncbi:hypothetical protein [Nannocystis exedens]|uniref:hypothetical protein n=1 Tax=Nannocystis exedens TaxID=54 RepID=UPI000BBA0943|nr:hypothetical protein [Nannocystis exedens]
MGGARLARIAALELPIAGAVISCGELDGERVLADEVYVVTVDPGVQTIHARRLRAGASRPRPARWTRRP